MLHKGLVRGGVDGVVHNRRGGWRFPSSPSYSLPSFSPLGGCQHAMAVRQKAIDTARRVLRRKPRSADGPGWVEDNLRALIPDLNV